MNEEGKGVGGFKKNEEWAEQEAVNQRWESGWRDEVRSVRRREGEREGSWPAAVEEDKMCGEVMAVMNSLWLISGSQVGV